MLYHLIFKKRKKLYSIVLFLFSIHAMAQNQSKSNSCKDVENTYQIISHQPRIRLAITSDVCEIVKRERKKDKTIIYKVNELYSIKIYSEKEIPTLKLPLEYIIFKEN